MFLSQLLNFLSGIVSDYHKLAILINAFRYASVLMSRLQHTYLTSTVDTDLIIFLIKS